MAAKGTGSQLFISVRTLKAERGCIEVAWIDKAPALRVVQRRIKIAKIIVVIGGFVYTVHTRWQ